MIHVDQNRNLKPEHPMLYAAVQALRAAGWRVYRAGRHHKVHIPNGSVRRPWRLLSHNELRQLAGNHGRWR